MGVLKMFVVVKGVLTGAFSICAHIKLRTRDIIAEKSFNRVKSMNTPLSPSMEITPEGYLICKSVPLARTGVQVYSATAEPEQLCDVNGVPLPALDGVIQVDKPEAVLFDPECIASWQNKPVTIGHNEVTAQNWRELSVGTAINVRRGVGPTANNLVADLLITDANAVRELTVNKDAPREISLGYDAQYQSDGPGLAHQTQIRGNHIAIVPQGKAGAFCRIYDSVPLQEVGKGKLMSLKEELNALIDKALGTKSLTNDSDTGNEEDKANSAPEQGTAPAAPAVQQGEAGEQNKSQDVEQNGVEQNPPLDPVQALSTKVDALGAQLTKLIEILAQKAGANTAEGQDNGVTEQTAPAQDVEQNGVEQKQNVPQENVPQGQDAGAADKPRQIIISLEPNNPMIKQNQ